MKGRNPLFGVVVKSTNSNVPVGKGERALLELETDSMSAVGKELLSQAQEDITKKIIKELYRPGAKIGDGGTADALKYEKQTGKTIAGKGHAIKAKERANQIKKIISKNPNHPDKLVLQKLLNDLEDALKGD